MQSEYFLKVFQMNKYWNFKRIPSRGLCYIRGTRELGKAEERHVKTIFPARRVDHIRLYFLITSHFHFNR